MAVKVRARVSYWVEIEVQSDDLDKAYDEVEEAVSEEDHRVDWSAPEIDDLEILEVTRPEPVIDPYDALRDREMDLIWTAG